MEPLNKKERAKAFNKVIGFFLLSLALAILVGFTTMNVNKLAESKSMNELKKLRDDLKFQQEIFAPNIDQATKIMAKVPVAKESGENSEILHQDIATLLSTTKNSTAVDESWESKMYQNILKVYSDLQLAYKEQTKLKEQLDDCMNNTQGSDVQLQRCLDEKRNLQNELTMLKLAGGGGGGGGGNTAEIEKNLRTANEQLRQCKLENKSLLSEISKLRNK